MSQESFTFTVGKLDAGMAILLGERAHLIEFPSILLPPGATTGSIVNIAVHQNHSEERRRDAEFWALQDEILQEFGVHSPAPPKLQLRNVTQTSITLEWPAIELATAKLRSLDIYRNGQRLAPIPSPLTNTSSKLSGLELNTEYTFQLILRTTAGTFPSNLIRVRTHTMSDTFGISVCFGAVHDPVMLENAKMALREMKAKWSDTIQIDTTHFVCTTPAATPSGAAASRSSPVAPGVEYQRALQLSIPVVQPHWIFACHTERKLVSIAAYNLGATPPTPSAAVRPQSMSQASLPRSPTSPNVRQSMPPLARSTTPGQTTSSFVNQPASSSSPTSPPATTATVTAPDDPSVEDAQTESASASAERMAVMEKRMSRTGTMNREFKFPPTSPTPVSPTGDAPNLPSIQARVVTPSNIEVPPPPPVEKEAKDGGGEAGDPGEEDVGDTVDIPLN
ncbi:fibronectin type III/BRCA1 domain-containing protein [Roridomyces roridus]|uniref:Fibronectin type III/BRCA1 domain-containing protein n=1 Tax=Roridomyces roridus TaxID=1738132 RepID=A0AAD7BRU6_9AGAR|nr:fibronectin type III/BRCA1 domain-containing protein [Roridomyces roridus]